MNEDHMNTIDKRFSEVISSIEREISDDLISSSELREFVEHKYLSLDVSIHIEREKLERSIKQSKQMELKFKKTHKVLSDIENCFERKAHEMSTDELISSIKQGRKKIHVESGEGVI